MSRARKSWQEKLADAKDLPRTMVIPSPAEVDEVMRRVPIGRLATINEVRAALARKHKTDIACPMTTGIFAWIAAHAAEEARAAGAKRITPYWRTLKSGGELNPKYPGGIPALSRLLRAEGHRVTRKGGRAVVADFEKSLARLQSTASPAGPGDERQQRGKRRAAQRPAPVSGHRCSVRARA